MSSLKDLGDETSRFYILLDAINKIDQRVYLQRPEYPLVHSLKEEVRKWTSSNRAKGVDLPYYPWVAPNLSRPSNHQGIVRLAKELRKNSTEFHIPTRTARRKERLQPLQIALLETLWGKCSTYLRPLKPRQVRRTSQQHTARTHFKPQAQYSAQVSSITCYQTDSHAILPSILDPPPNAFSSPSEAKLMNELRLIAEAWLHANDKWATWTASTRPDTRITIPRALADLINITVRTTLMDEAELLLFNNFLVKIERWELANGERQTGGIHESPVAALDAVTATQTDSAFSSLTETDATLSFPENTAYLTAHYEDFATAAPLAHPPNNMTTPTTVFTFVSPEVEAMEQNEDDAHKKKRELGIGWGFEGWD